MKSLINRFRPGEEGLKQILGELESEIMEVIWLKNEASVRDVLKEIEQRKEIAYTTVMTVMVRLHEKGLIERTKDGQAFIYSPAVTKEELEEDTVKSIFKSILTGSSKLAISNFVDEVSKDPESLKELQDLINKRLKK